VSVTVRLPVEYAPEAGRDEAAIAAQRQAIKAAYADIVAVEDAIQVAGYSFEVNHRFVTIPYAGVRATGPALEHLFEFDLVTEVIAYEKAWQPLLGDSTAIINADSLRSTYNLSGTGENVAIIDSGVDYTHSAFAGRYTDGNCFSHPNDGFPSLCEANAYTNPSAQPATGGHCDNRVFGCRHGTGVAGIATGSDSEIEGVGVQSGLITVMAAHASTDCGPTGSASCTRYEPNNVLSGLDWINQHTASDLSRAWRNGDPQVAAVNLSLGGSLYSGTCDSSYPAFVDPISDLKAKQVGVVAGSGNDGNSSSIIVPACLSDVTSVAATTKSDGIWGGSNRSSALDLLAPGASIYTADIAILGGYQTNSGTSYAAPHVAGSIALLREDDTQYTSDDIDDLVEALRSTGEWISSGSSSWSRIDVQAAYEILRELSAPAAPSSISVISQQCFGFNSVNWASSFGTANYHLQGAYDSSFTHPFTLYDGANASTTINVDQETWIRVRACNSAGCSSEKIASQTAQYVPYCM
jgi:subtilisin family serine protease